MEYDLTDAGYDGYSFIEYGMSPDGIVANGAGYVEGQNDGFVAIEIAKYLMHQYNDDGKMNAAKDALGIFMTEDQWSALGSDQKKKAGAIASKIVNRPLHATSFFTFTDAAMFGIGELNVAQADKAKTEWFLAEARKRYQSMQPLSAVEKPLVEAQIAADTAAESVNLDDFTLRQQAYALMKKNNVAVPVDPTTNPAWTAATATTDGDSLKYGVYSLPATFPSLYKATVDANDGPRNAIFKSIRDLMVATPTKALIVAAHEAIDAYALANTGFKSLQMPLEYASADVTKVFGTRSSLFDNTSVNAIMKIVNDDITTDLFGGSANYFVTVESVESLNPIFTTYKAMFDRVQVTLTDIVKDDASPAGP